MSNKNKGKVVQMLSPENYIRKKARTLPIHECWINSDWEESGVANIVIARMHTNGNITFCLYLVDLYCLGVKDSFFQFNIIHAEYKNFLEKLEDKMDMELTEYVLVHNIILSGVEYAEEFGFKPYKDFTSVTQFMLEEDTDDIELIEIECGKDGKPLYIQGPYENTATANKIIKQLEHIAGKDNFHFIQELDLQNNDDEWGAFETNLDEMGNKFMQYFSRMDKLSEAENEVFIDLTQQIVDELMDLDEYNRYCEELWKELTQLKIDHENIPNELIGINDKYLIIPDEIKKGFQSVVNGVESFEQAKKQFKLFSKNKGVDAAIDYLDIVISDIDGSKKYESKLKEAASKYPDYAILQLKWTKHNALLQEEIKLMPHYPCKLENYFPGRDSIHPWEFFCYIETYIHVVVAETNFAKLDALKSVIYDLELLDNEIDIFNTIITMFQVMFVESYFKE
ncbi:hypothetical protein MASR2M47_40050 [Draconibacterium sp.]